jgi:hypothetical protein
MSDCLHNASLEEKMEYLIRVLGEALDAVDLPGFMYIPLDDGDEVTVRWPACDDQCPHPDECHNKIQKHVGERLLAVRKDDAVKTVLHRTTLDS